MISQIPKANRALLFRFKGHAGHDFSNPKGGQGAAPRRPAVENPPEKGQGVMKKVKQGALPEKLPFLKRKHFKNSFAGFFLERGAAPCLPFGSGNSHPACPLNLKNHDRCAFANFRNFYIIS